MSTNVETMFYVGKAPWHSLGGESFIHAGFTAGGKIRLPLYQCGVGLRYTFKAIEKNSKL